METAEDSAVADFLQILEEHRRNCERQGKYVEAEIAKNRLDELKVPLPLPKTPKTPHSPPRHTQQALCHLRWISPLLLHFFTSTAAFFAQVFAERLSKCRLVC